MLSVISSKYLVKIFNCIKSELGVLFVQKWGLSHSSFALPVSLWMQEHGGQIHQSKGGSTRLVFLKQFY